MHCFIIAIAAIGAVPVITALKCYVSGKFGADKRLDDFTGHTTWTGKEVGLCFLEANGKRGFSSDGRRGSIAMICTDSAHCYCGTDGCNSEIPVFDVRIQHFPTAMHCSTPIVRLVDGKPPIPELSNIKFTCGVANEDRRFFGNSCAITIRINTLGRIHEMYSDCVLSLGETSDCVVGGMEESLTMAYRGDKIKTMSVTCLTPSANSSEFYTYS